MPQARDFDAGYVYIMHCEGIYKIGISKNPLQRLYEVQKDADSQLKRYQKIAQNTILVDTIAVTSMFPCEQIVHHILDKKRIYVPYSFITEWFRLVNNDIDLIHKLVLEFTT